MSKDQSISKPAYPSDQRTDEALLFAYRNGEAAAMTVLVQRFESELLGFLTRMMGNRAAAEDVFQDTFVQIHISADAFDVSRRFKPWLFTIAANKGRDYYRKHGRHNASVDLSAPVRRSGGTSDGLTFVDLLEADIPALDEVLDREELQNAVRVAIDRLPHHFREIILLAYFQRMSYNQIAEMLNIPLGTVKSRLHTAIANFAESWKQNQADSNGKRRKKKNKSELGLSKAQ